MAAAGGAGKKRKGCNVRRATSKIFSAVSALILSAAVVQPADAGPIFLSDFLGGASGTAVVASNPPYTTVITPAASGGFGIDTLGGFSSGQLIDFIGSDPYDKGIGAHPISSIEFNLTELRSIAPFAQFEAVIGISPAFGGQNGARFIVAVDGTQVFQLDVLSIDWGGTPITIPIPIDATTLRLETQRITDAGGNHAAWADAKLAVPEPGTSLLLMTGVILMLRRRTTNA